MGKLEREVKILGVNKIELERMLEQLGAEKVEECLQKIYVYDLPSIYARFCDCLLQLKRVNKPYEFEICRNKLQGILNEVDNLTTGEEQRKIEETASTRYLVDLLNRTNNEDLLDRFSNKSIVEIIKKYGINPNKWVRVRETSGRTTITIKHILNPDLQKEVKADQSSKRIICRALGYPAETEKQIQRSLKKLHDEYWQEFSPPVKVALESEIKPLVLYIIVRQADQNKAFSFVLTREDGTTQAGIISLADGQIMETAVFDSEIYLRYQIRLYLDVGQGYHSLSFLMDNQKIKSNAQTRLIVVPSQCFVQESLLSGHKAWGFPLQLYALQSDRNWGIGDFTDLCQMAHLSKKLGADLLGINPVNALFSDAPEQASPYSPSSRVFLNPLYIDIDAVPEAVDCTALADYKKSDRFKEVLCYLKADNQVNYDYVSELKLTALEILFKVFKAVHLDEKGSPITPRGESFKTFIQEYGEQLETFATFQVLRQYFKTQGQSLLWWRWEKGYLMPDGDLIKSFQKKYADSILFVKYQQFLAYLIGSIMINRESKSSKNASTIIFFLSDTVGRMP